MTANASKDSTTSRSMMAPVAGRVSESVLAIMQHFGIQKIESSLARSANLEKVVASVTFFKGTPQEITSCGLLVKDQIAEILAAVGVVRLEITADENEEAAMVKEYAKIVAYNETMKASTEGSCAEACEVQVSDGANDKVDGAGTKEEHQQ